MRYFREQIAGENFDNYAGQTVRGGLSRFLDAWADDPSLEARFRALRDLENEVWYLTRLISWELQEREDAAYEAGDTGLVTRKEYKSS